MNYKPVNNKTLAKINQSNRVCDKEPLNTPAIRLLQQKLDKIWAELDNLDSDYDKPGTRAYQLQLESIRIGGELSRLRYPSGT